MNARLDRRLLVLFLLGAGCRASAPPPDAHSFAPGQLQLVHRARDLPYGPGPSSIPFACELAVLEGDPQSDGLFTIRLRTHEPWTLPPHRHPRAERVTVLSGAIHVAFGPLPAEPRPEPFTSGDYYVSAPGAVHHVWTEGPVEIQITGIGPWEVEWVE